MFGSHLSIAGGLHNALLEAESLGMDTVQVFTKNQQQWRVPPLSPQAVSQWSAHLKRLRFKCTVSHDSYLINLASPDAALWQKSVDLFVEEVRRCHLLGIRYLVAHPGAHMGSGEEVGLARVARALDAVHERISSPKVVTCLEITAGQGTSLGYRLEHIATIMDRVRNPDRLGVCLDTAHLFAAGYDFRGRRFATFRRNVSATVGIRTVKVLHLNDSKRELGSRVDRHEHIGRGMIGLDGFKPIVCDASLGRLPKILETAKGKAPDGRDWDAVNLATLRSLVAGAQVS